MTGVQTCALPILDELSQVKEHDIKEQEEGDEEDKKTDVQEQGTEDNTKTGVTKTVVKEHDTKDVEKIMTAAQYIVQDFLCSSVVK